VLSEAELRNAIRSCRYCPMCHHADLTMTLERRETYSARGRGLLLSALEQGKMTWNADVAEVMFGFFADGLSRHVCAGHIPHDEIVLDARRRLVAAGHAPAAVAKVKTHLETTGNPWGEEEPDLRALPGAKPHAEVLVYFGASARIRRPGNLHAMATLMKKVSTSFAVLAEEGDPGLLLHELGEAEAGAAAARTLAKKVAASGARVIVTADAEAYRTFKTGVGTTPPLSNITVLHAAEFLAQSAGDLEFRPPTQTRVAYHDPCALARFAPCMEAPRTLLWKILGAPPIEIGTWSGELAHCSGECGGVPFVQPALSRKAATYRVVEARNTGAELVVAGSPAAAAALEAQGLPVRELTEFVAESLIA
jgi:Fe-S oxidoreductase